MSDFGCFVVACIIGIVLLVSGVAIKKKWDSTTTTVVAQDIPEGPTEATVKQRMVQIPTVAMATATTTTHYTLPDFTVGTLTFWILLLALIIAFVASDAAEIGWTSILAILIALSLVQWMGTSDPLGYAIKHPSHAAFVFVGYFICGLAWAMLKWVAESVKVKNERREKQEEFLTSHKLTGYRIPIALKDEWERFQRANHVPGRPLIREHKARFIRWIYAWPGSVIWTLFADFFRSIGTYIYYAISRQMQSLSDAIWGDVDKYVDDVVKREPPANSEL